MNPLIYKMYSTQLRQLPNYIQYDEYKGTMVHIEEADSRGWGQPVLRFMAGPLDTPLDENITTVHFDTLQNEQIDRLLETGNPEEILKSIFISLRVGGSSFFTVFEEEVPFYHRKEFASGETIIIRFHQDISPEFEERFQILAKDIFFGYDDFSKTFHISSAQVHFKLFDRDTHRETDGFLQFNFNFILQHSNLNP